MLPKVNGRRADGPGEPLSCVFLIVYEYSRHLVEIGSKQKFLLYSELATPIFDIYCEMSNLLAEIEKIFRKVSFLMVSSFTWLVFFYAPMSRFSRRD